MFADGFNLFLIYLKIESKWSILGGSCVCVCVSVATSERAYLATENGTIRGKEEEKNGPHSYRLSQKNTGEDDIFFSILCLFCLYF